MEAFSQFYMYNNRVWPNCYCLGKSLGCIKQFYENSSVQQQARGVCLGLLAEAQRTKESSLLRCSVNPQFDCSVLTVAVLSSAQTALALLSGPSDQDQGQLCTRAWLSWQDCAEVQSRWTCRLWFHCLIPSLSIVLHAYSPNYLHLNRHACEMQIRHKSA